MPSGTLKIVTSSEANDGRQARYDPEKELVKNWGQSIRDEVLKEALVGEHSFDVVWNDALERFPKPGFLDEEYAQSSEFDENDFRDQLNYLWNEIRKNQNRGV